ncbi:hypothetical protein RJT34_23817 [Clitoria ternatea]|uniref:Uncharacterized protein n=1 Tax=Clitoria ternatea TaxID=43366 RepID=A0AAN9FPJ9_CLITE
MANKDSCGTCGEYLIPLQYTQSLIRVVEASLDFCSLRICLNGDPSLEMVIFPKREGRYKYLSIYLNAGDAATLPCGWCKFATFKLSLVNQINAHMTLTRGDVV